MINIYNEPVKVRTKKLSNGNESIYLDICINGNRKTEYLKLYLYPGNSADVKKRNKETMMIANAVKLRRITEIQNDRFGFMDKERGKILLIDWMNNLRDEGFGVKSKNFLGTLKSTIMHLEKYMKGKSVMLKDGVTCKSVCQA